MIFVTETKDININTPFSVLYFYTNSITYHDKLMIMIEKVQSKYSNINFFAIDCDYLKDFYKQFEIDIIPFIIVFSNGKQIFKTGSFYKTKNFIRLFDNLHQKYCYIS